MSSWHQTAATSVCPLQIELTRYAPVKTASVSRAEWRYHLWRRAVVDMCSVASLQCIFICFYLWCVSIWDLALLHRCEEVFSLMQSQISELHEGPFQLGVDVPILPFCSSRCVGWNERHCHCVFPNRPWHGKLPQHSLYLPVLLGFHLQVCKLTRYLIVDLGVTVGHWLHQLHPLPSARPIWNMMSDLMSISVALEDLGPVLHQH